MSAMTYGGTRMKQLLLITLLLLSHGSVYAEWVSVEKDYLVPVTCPL